MNIKLLIIFISFKLFIFSSFIFGEDKDEIVTSVKDNKSNVGYEIPRFKHIKIKSSIKNYTPMITLNEGITSDVKVTKSGFSKKDQTFNIESDGISIEKFRLGLKNKKGKVIFSDNKTVFWPGAEAEKANELRDIIEELPGVNVSMERDPSNTENLIITIKQNK